MSLDLVLCDDELSIVKAAEFKLKKAGYSVGIAPDGEAAFELIQAERPAMVITDFQMPRMDGLGLITRLRTNPATMTMPIILLTAKRLEINVEEMQARWGLTAIMAKPFSPKELLQITEQTIGPATRNKVAPAETMVST